MYNELFILYIITSTILWTSVLNIKNLVPKCAMVQNDKTSNDGKKVSVDCVVIRMIFFSTLFRLGHELVQSKTDD